MTLDQLRVFVEVAQRQHLTQAAAALALTPSAVSASIKSLEDRYGVPLFHRVGRRIELSSAGRVFLLEAQRTLASARAAERTLAELGELKRGTLAIHASQTIASYWLPSLIVAFRQAYPAIELQLKARNTEDVASAVLQGEADLGLVEGAVDQSTLAVLPVDEDEMVVVVAPGHAWAGGAPLAPADLPASQWVLREAGSGTRSAFEAALADLGIAPAALQVALELPSNEAVRGAVLAGAFATATSALVVASHIASGQLVRAGIELPARRFSLLRHPERHRSRAAIAFEDLLRARCPVYKAHPPTHNRTHAL